MTDTDIVERLRELSATCGYHGSKKILDGGAAEIKRLRHENSRLHAALSRLTTDITQSQAAMDAVSLAAFEDACATLNIQHPTGKRDD